MKIGDIKSDNYKNKFIWSFCIDCGKERWVRLCKNKPTSIKCKSCANTRENNPRWKGGRHKDGHGYIVINRGHNIYAKEHRLMMAEHLGRPLTESEVVHHINEVRNDNRIENLELLKNDSEHTVLHWRLRQVI